MKKLLFHPLLIIIICTACKAQDTKPVSNTFIDYKSGEFTTYNNGLIYSEATMQQLTHIVDSLNLKFKRCDLTKKYNAFSQGIGRNIKVKKADIKQALADMKANTSLEDFLKKYKTAVAEDEMLIIKTRSYDDDAKRWTVEFSGEIMDDYNNPSIYINNDPSIYDRPLKGKWVIDHSAKTSYSDESLEAFYITEEFQATEIPVKYARMILYSDCVIDTTADIFKNKTYPDIFSNDERKKSDKMELFMNYINGSTSHIKEKNVPASYPGYKWHALDSMRTAWVANNLAQTDKFKQLLANAVTDVKQKNASTGDEFENYVANYYSKADALEMKRNRRVMGMCSMDQAPRQHALNIAKLSAESVNWEVFLRAHLNIMNDRFDRVSDGSWAWAGRKTYIKELEDLNIEVHELLFGICFRIENPVKRHYYGSIGRLGRALAETKDRTQLDNELLGMISDNELDTYNRILMHFLYLNYAYYLPLKEDRMASLLKLEEADKTLPQYISSRIKINKKNFEKQED